MDMNRAQDIVNKMARERYATHEKVLEEFLKYQKDGECTQFWPDENTACRMLIARRLEK
jgi:hypothetical protein